MTLHASVRDTRDELLSGPNLRLRIGEHVVDTGALRVVTRPELPRLTSKAVAVLVELVRNVGQTVTRDQLLDRVWTGRFPTPDVLTQAVKELRRALGDDSKPPQYIETIPKLGYRLIAPVLVLDGPESAVVIETATPVVEQRAIESRPLERRAVDEPREIASANDAPIPPHVPRFTRALRWTLVVAGCGIVLAAAAIVIAHLRSDAAAAARASRTWTVGARRVITSDPGAERRPQLSPDGTRVAFAAPDPVATTRVVVRSIEPSQVVHITHGGDTQEMLPAWSPDGTRIAFERVDEDACTMYVASSLGGDEREVGACRDVTVNYFDWTPDGRGLITAQSPTGGGELALVKLDLDSGEREFLKYARTDADQDLEPHYSPDGRFIAFRRGVAPYSDLYVMPSAGGDVRQVTHIASRIRGHTWTRDGRALVFASNFGGAMALYAVDVESGHVQSLGVAPAEYPDAARDADTIAYEIPRTQNQLAEISLAETGLTETGLAGDRVETLAPSTGSDYASALSPDGARIAFVSDRGGRSQLWLDDRATGAVTPLSEANESPLFWPRWRADGKAMVAVRIDAPSRRQLIEIDVATRRQRVLTKDDDNVLFGSYGVEPDSYVVALGESGRGNELVLVNRPGTPDESRRPIATGVAFAQVDAAARAVYYTASSGEGLYRFDLERGEQRFVTPKVSSVTTNGWRIVDGHIWYLTGIEVKPLVLHDLDPATGEERELKRIDIALKDVNFSITPARDAIVLSQIGTEDTDVGVFTLTRAAH
jgi:Tol biopolymer transport system component/DNA-binding winged helix-turn-helix (wHTH) protein